jgi:uncharacterized protein YdbL (DUF1318 family)
MRSRVETSFRLAAALVATLFLFAHAPAARADALDDAKASGLVGERLDGYVGLVDPNAPAGVKTLVEEVNRKRAHQYEMIAKKNSTNATAVATLAGAKLVERVAAGQFVMDASGTWKKQ